MQLTCVAPVSPSLYVSQRLGSAEIESALVAHAKVSEAAVIGFPHDTKGEGICCYVTLKEGVEETAEMAAELKHQVRKVIGPFATPDYIILTAALPKTRSGKVSGSRGGDGGAILLLWILP